MSPNRTILLVEDDRDICEIVEQVIGNILTNALKYGRDEPVSVEVSGSHDTAMLVVRDRGIGISKADQERIFERFERAVSVEHYAGFGLGLWMARHLVAAMGGAIEVESEPEAGATFRITLPRRATDGKAAA